MNVVCYILPLNNMDIRSVQIGEGESVVCISYTLYT